MYSHFWCLGLVLAVEELWQCATFNGVQTVVIKPRRVAWHDDMMCLFRYIVIVLTCIVCGRGL